jgi:hypothetical protein
LVPLPRAIPVGEKERRDLLTILSSTPATLRALVAGLGDEEARRRHGPPDEWSVSEIAAHLVDAEQAWLQRRIRLMAEQDHPRLPYYPDLDYTRPGLPESLEEFAGLRQANVAYLEALPPPDWRRRGTHERWGEITITWAVRHIAAHDAEHLAQLSRVLARA